MSSTEASTSGDFVLLLMLIASFLHATYYLVLGITHPQLDYHAFRQTRTALTAYWMRRGGLWLAYETPVLGYPWVTDYNTARPHSSLGYKTPAAYSGTLTAPRGVTSETSRRWMKVQWQVTRRLVLLRPHRALRCSQGIMVRAERKSKNEIARFRRHRVRNPATSNRPKLQK